MGRFGDDEPEPLDRPAVPEWESDLPILSEEEIAANRERLAKLGQELAASTSAEKVFLRSGRAPYGSSTPAGVKGDQRTPLLTNNLIGDNDDD